MADGNSSSGFSTIAGPELGSGPDQIGLLLGEDAYDGDVQFTISVDGVQIGGVQTVTAIQADDTDELFTLDGTWAAGSTVSVNFLNDDWDGSGGNGHDRNLYVDGLTYAGTTVSDTVHTVNWSGPSYYPTQATVRAADLVGGLGVTTHLLYADTTYANEPLVLAELQYLGIDHVRDGGTSSDAASLTPFEAAMAAGIKFDLTTAMWLDPQQTVANIETLLAGDPGGIVSVEGINEVPASFSYGGLTGEDAANLFQQQLYAAVHDDPDLAGIAVLNYTLLDIYDSNDYTRYGDISSEADDGNVHLYGYGGISNDLSTLLPRMLEGTPNSKGFVVTETGYDTLSNGDDVSAKYLLDAVFDFKQAGASMTYLYELMDENADPGLTDTEDHFGLFNSDGTPKEAATAFHNLTAILADPGSDASTFTPGTLAYTLSGLPADGNSMVLARSTGSFDLVVWAEPLILAATGSAQEIAAPVTPVTVTFGTTVASAFVYDPLLGSTPVMIYLDTGSIVLPVTDHPLIVEVTPELHAPLDASVSNVSGASPLFDRAYYLAHNPDVAAAGVDAYQHYLTSGWKEGRNPSAAFDTNDYLAAHPAVKAAGVDPLLQYIQTGQAEGLSIFAVPDAAADPLVDATYYYARNPDVAAADVDASEHYATFGWREGRNPDAWFDSNYYLQQNPDVKAAGIDPLAHFEEYGWREGRAPSLLFDDAKYLAAYPDVKAAGVDPLLHYVQSGASEGRMTFLTGGVAAADPLVDAAFYDAQLGATLIPTGTAAVQQATWSYETTGWLAGLNPNALFDTRYYIAENPGVDFMQIDPLQHYETIGWKEGLDPSAQFSTNKYLAAYAGVKAAGTDPLLDYVQSGQAQGRVAFAV